MHACKQRTVKEQELEDQCTGMSPSIIKQLEVWQAHCTSMSHSTIKQCLARGAAEESGALCVCSCINVIPVTVPVTIPYM